MEKQQLQELVNKFCLQNSEFELCRYNTEWIVAGDYSDAIFSTENQLIEYASIELTEIFVERGGFETKKNNSVKSSIIRNSGNIVFPYHLFAQYYSVNKYSDFILSKIFFDYIYLYIGSDIGIFTHPLIDLANLIDPQLYINNSKSYCASTDNFLKQWGLYPPKEIIDLVFESNEEDRSWFRDLPLESFDWYESENWEAIASFLG